MGESTLLGIENILRLSQRENLQNIISDSTWKKNLHILNKLSKIKQT